MSIFDNDKNYKLWQGKGEKILEKLKQEIKRSGYRENLGQREHGQYDDNLQEQFASGALNYQEISRLSQWLFTAILDL